MLASFKVLSSHARHARTCSMGVAGLVLGGGTMVPSKVALYAKSRPRCSRVHCTQWAPGGKLPEPWNPSFSQLYVLPTTWWPCCRLEIIQESVKWWSLEIYVYVLYHMVHQLVLTVMAHAMYSLFNSDYTNFSGTSDRRGTVQLQVYPLVFLVHSCDKIISFPRAAYFWNLVAWPLIMDQITRGVRN